MVCALYAQVLQRVGERGRGGGHQDKRCGISSWELVDLFTCLRLLSCVALVAGREEEEEEEGQLGTLHLHLPPERHSSAAASRRARRLYPIQHADIDCPLTLLDLQLDPGG